MDAFTAAQTAELCSRIGTKKSTTRLDKLFFNSVMTGPLLGFGCAVLLSTEAAPWFQQNAPGLIRTIAAVMFPIGLVMIMLTGSDLYTSNVMFMTIALLHRRVTIIDLLKVWFVSFFGNLAGMLFFVLIITGYGGVFDQEGYKEAVFNFAYQKAVLPQWHQIVLRAIGANWLVCLAVYMSISAREIVSKITAIWWPTATFVALGLDHVVANMYFIPIAIFYGDPQITTSFYIWKSLIPTLIGNTIGGAIMVALPYWYLYLLGDDVEVDFNIGAVDTAISDAGGPLRPSRSHMQHIIHGREIDDNHAAGQLPSSSGVLASAVGKELSPDKYAQSRGRTIDKEKDGQSEETAV